MTALLAHAGFLYSASYDGAVKMWDADTMELVQDVKRAHEGGRINCATIGADGNLYTGGDDKVCTQQSTLCGLRMVLLAKSGSEHSV